MQPHANGSRDILILRVKCNGSVAESTSLQVDHDVDLDTLPFVATFTPTAENKSKRTVPLPTSKTWLRMQASACMQYYRHTSCLQVLHD